MYLTTVLRHAGVAPSPCAANLWRPRLKTCALSVFAIFASLLCEGRSSIVQVPREGYCFRFCFYSVLFCAGKRPSSCFETLRFYPCSGGDRDALESHPRFRVTTNSLECQRATWAACAVSPFLRVSMRLCDFASSPKRSRSLGKATALDPCFCFWCGVSQTVKRWQRYSQKRQERRRASTKRGVI